MEDQPFPDLRSYFFIFKIYLFLIGIWLIYNVVMVSEIHQHGSAIAIHMSPPSWTSLLFCPTRSHPFLLSQNNQFKFPASYSKSPLAIYFTHGNVNVSKLLQGFIIRKVLCNCEGWEFKNLQSASCRPKNANCKFQSNSKAKAGQINISAQRLSERKGITFLFNTFIVEYF